MTNLLLDMYLDILTTMNLVFKTLDMALEASPGASPMIHSDRGFQYTSHGFKHKLDASRNDAKHVTSR